MAGETQRQLLKENQTLLADLKKVKDQIARLEKRHKAQGQRPQQGERRFGDALDAGYVEPKPPDPSWISQQPTSQTHIHHVANSRFDHKSFADKIKLFTFSGGRSYLFGRGTLKNCFTATTF